MKYIWDLNSKDESVTIVKDIKQLIRTNANVWKINGVFEKD